MIRQLLPDRLADFASHYEQSKSRKEITYENYRIKDYLQGLVVTRQKDDKIVVGRDGAFPHFRQQIAIFHESTIRKHLFDIRQLVQAELFDLELDAATELVNKGFVRAAGAVAGVVLEHHLSQVCENHAV